MDNTSLLVNLVLALAMALVGAALAARLGQSVILGYILAGIAIGPFTPGFVGDIEAVEALADIGIVFLMFTIGVEFSFRDLRRAGRVASFGGLLQIALMMGLGYLVGFLLGWGVLEPLFFGAAIAISSTAVLAKVLSERGETGAEHGRVALGWAAIQDLGTVALVVALAAVSTGGRTPALDILSGIARAALFLALLLPVGLWLLPRLLEWVAALRSREVFILAAAVVALGTAYISSLFGLSLALGAFVAGMVVSESDLSHRVLGELIPLRDVLAGLFFVAVGILFDPSFVLGNLPLVLLTVALIVLAKGVIAAAIALAFRYPGRTALLTGALLAQSGEFTFLLVRLGADRGVVTPEVFNLVVAGSVASIILAPFLMKLAHPFGRWLERRAPASALARLPKQEDVGDELRGHAVICGYGRVGRVIGSALRRRSFPFAVIEQDPRLVRRLRERGVPALLGNADNAVLLDRVHIAQARALVIAIPDALATRQIVDYAQRVNPQLDIVARTHSAAEFAFLHSRGVRGVVIGELELALEMARQTLRRFGVSAAETLAIVQGLRQRTPVEEDGPALGLAE